MTSCAGLPATSWYRGWYGRTLAADRVNGNTFYMLHDAGTGAPPQFFRSTNGGANWANTGASFAGAATFSINATVKAHPYQAGQLWVAFSPNDNVAAADLPTKFKLWYSADGGTSFRAVVGVQAAFNVASGCGVAHSACRRGNSEPICCAFIASLRAVSDSRCAVNSAACG